MKIKEVLKTVFLTSICLSLMACSDDAEETVQNIQEAPELQGKSESRCSSLGIDELAGFSKKDTLSLIANQSSFETKIYSNTDCSDSEEVGVISYSGEFQVERTSGDDEENMGEIVFELEEAKITVSGEKLVSLLNTINFCGYSEYQLDETVELTSESDELLCPLTDTPAVLFGSYKYDEEEDMILLNDEPVEMENSDDLPELPLIEVFASEYKKQ